MKALRDAAIYCQPTPSMAYQAGGNRYVVRGVESGGAVPDVGNYIAFCDAEGRPVPWLQPIHSVGANRKHAVVIAPSLISVETFRVEHTYELLIARHEPRTPAPGRAAQLWSEVVFRGRQGYLSLELWGRDREAAGKITPEFFTRAGDRHEIPPRFTDVVRAVTKGANCIGCSKAVWACAPGDPVAAGDRAISTKSDPLKDAKKD